MQRPLEGRASSQSGSHLRLVLSLAAQASLVMPEAWPSWVPTSASSSHVSIKGAISLEPVPSKNVQFISLGIHPIMQDQRNELLDEHERESKLFVTSSYLYCYFGST